MATSINAVQWNTPYKQVPPSYNTQQNQLMKADWGSMAGYGQSPNMYVPPVFPVSKAGAGRGGPSFLGRDTYNDALRASSRLGRQVPTPTTPPVPYSVDGAYKAINPTQMFSQPMAALNSVLPAAVNPVTMVGSPQANMSYAPDAGGFNLPKYINTVGASGLPAGGTGTGAGWFDGLLGNGKEAWNNNKDWLVGDKNSIGAIPLGVGLFNAFNQYTQGRESIKNMREQNALARESFDLNKKGALASLEDQYNKRNTNEAYWANPNMSYTSVKDAASAKTLEDMKRFK